MGCDTMPQKKTHLLDNVQAFIDEADDDPNFPLPRPEEVVDEYSINLVWLRKRPWSTLHPHEEVLLYRRLVDSGMKDSTIRSRYLLGPWKMSRLRAEAFPSNSAGTPCRNAA